MGNKSHNEFAAVIVIAVLLIMVTVIVLKRSAPLSGFNEETETTVAQGLEVPWEIAFLPNGDMLVTERPGRLLRIGEGRQVIEIDGVEHVGEGGLLGLALHPDFAQNQLIYLYLTTRVDGGLMNRVERYRLEGAVLSDRTDIVTNIPGSSFHDGGRMAFGPDGYLYIATGDAETSLNAQDTNSLAGKILRVNADGGIPEDNPFGNAVYSYGHRNPQGLAWDTAGQLWAIEHGRSGLRSGFDELNRIEKGGNYGWPEIQGDETQESMINPVVHSGAAETWAPASLIVFNDDLYFTGLRGASLYWVQFTNGSPNVTPFLKNVYGRLRAMAVSPDGDLYVGTSNRDGRGTVQEGDDRILRVDIDVLE